MRIRNIWAFCLVVFTVCAAYAEGGTSNALPRPTTKNYVDTMAATKQEKISAQTGNYVVMYPDSTSGDTNHDGAGEIDARHVSDVLTGTASDNVAVADVDIPTVGAVNAGLGGKQANIPAGTAGNIVTYSGTAGTVQSHDLYRANQAYNANGLIEADHANTAIQTGLNNHLSCTNNTGPNNECWLYKINTQAAGTVYTPTAPSGGGNG